MWRKRRSLHQAETEDAAELVSRTGQAEILPQSPTFVLRAEQTPTSQFGNDQLNEVIQPPGQIGRHDLDSSRSLIKPDILESYPMGGMKLA